jgi:ubiquinone/menaquinone biosynthesis C-methylase UbiE
MKEHQIKEKVKERYGKIALVGSSSEGCCAPSECCGNNIGTSSTISVASSPLQIATRVGYNIKELESIPESSILGVGCGAPVNFADIQEGEIVVDIGSGGGIDVFLSAKSVKDSGKVIGIDMTDEMLEKARTNAKENGYINVEFRKGDIEERIPVDDNFADVVISNCVINLFVDKVAAFKEIYRILRSNGGRLVISDLVTSKEVGLESADTEEWCNCVDGALTKENYIESIRRAGFNSVEVLQEEPYLVEKDKTDGRKITSLVIKALK